ncbi:MAG: hypothetical protein GTN86_06595 [Xanthomonadales bacterium]|nr:hypothetical protein [Xanthomonadales bacterium]NIN60558.1 hypothetical protein [Xanthomonadales bacterium]NIN75910.1 hypothetical protein [Xanthomonadales bacterium]NIO15002.1 hypothetical protein [Xanthomonadales bacterium]NIP12951.1 hypothetical protein [Xanthomonadales bacterium]
MTPELTLLATTAAAVAFVHTLLGPDHYLPFAALAKARGWGVRQTLRIASWCGLGHLVGSVSLGAAGIALGWQLSSLEWVEGMRGSAAGWALAGFGLAYAAWGLRRAHRKRRHSHWHSHGARVHRHFHAHHDRHLHLHAEGRSRGAAWLVFIIFVLGPCEPLIPLLMYPAATQSWAGVMLVTVVFSVVTVLTMLLAVAASLRGLRALRWEGMERYSHVAAGVTIMACGLSVSMLGM